MPVALADGTNTGQIVTWVLSGMCSFIGILVSVFRIYPAINSRVAKLREAGIKPTLKRVVFLDKTLSKYRPLLEQNKKSDSRDYCETNASSTSSIAHAPSALLSLSANQIGHLVRL